MFEDIINLSQIKMSALVKDAVKTAEKVRDEQVEASRSRKRTHENFRKRIIKTKKIIV